MNSREMSVVAVLAFVTPLLVLGDPFVYSDHWPSGTGDETATEVVVPDNTSATISTAEDVARVARLTAISLSGSAAKVDYTASDALALAASVSGSGKFSAISSGNLTLSGDNSGLESPGCFFFSNMAVTVASRYGLGSANTARLEYFFASKMDPLHFMGEGLTNDASLRIHQGSAAYNCVLGPDNANETLVIRNDFILDGGTGNGNNNDRRIFFRNKVRFCGGTFGADDAVTSARHQYCGTLSGETAEVWFDEGVTLKFYFMFSSGDIRYHLKWDGLTGVKYLFSPYSPVFSICERNDVLGDLDRGLSGDGTIDLNGFDQSVKLISKAYGSGKVKITSETPATYTMTSSNADANYMSSSVKFSGKVNFTYNPASASAAYTLTGISALSDSSGTLTVANGTLTFADRAGWSGTNVVVKSGATLELNSANAMTNTTATLTVESGGSLVLRSGATCVAKSATIAGTTLNAGETYTVAKLRDEMLLPVDGDDLANITIAGGGGEWNGWPTTPGAVAEVPSGVTVYVSDDDVATIEALDGIVLRSGAMVICTNMTRQLELSAPVSGTGIFKAFDSEKIVLSGDNSGLLSPGCFFFSNTAVTVASRYGLGSVGTATLECFFGDKVGPLHFTGAGLTNDVPLRIHQGTVDYNFVIGPDNANETLVIRNDFIFDSGTGSGYNETKRMFIRNKVRFQGGTFGCHENMSYLYVRGMGDSPEVWFEDDVKVEFYYWFVSLGLKCHLGWDGMQGNHYLFGLSDTSPRPYAVCERSNVFAGLVNGISGPCTFDLNGLDQSVGKISKQYGSPLITSETPATFTVTSYRNDSANYTSSSTKFSGKVDFTYNPGSASGVYTLTGSGALSDSSGKLTVASGALTFADGAGWCGTNVVVKGGATLAVGADSMPVAFGSRAVLGHPVRAKLEIESGGTLELAASAEPATVRTLVYNGQIKPAGRYTSASGVGITGGGTLYVRSSTDGEPGAMVIVY